MIIQRINGGLGNQMFQYAYIKSLSLRNNIDFKIDITEYKKYFRPYELEIFNIENKYAIKEDIPFYMNYSIGNKFINIVKSILTKLNNNHHYENQLNFLPYFLNIKSGYIEGYFQTEKYFLDYENEIRKDFEFTLEPSNKNNETINIINNCNSISLHIRRGDYVSNSNANNFHGTCSLDYYNKAIELINSKINDPVFFIFSDDMDWVKVNLKIKEKTYFVDWNNSDTNFEDMRLMSLCKHNIIANSSFSWWGAWLNKNKEKIVIAPSKWFNNSNANYSDIVPNKWLKI